MKTTGSSVWLVAATALFVSAAGAASKPVTLELKLPPKPAFGRPKMAALLTAAPLSLAVVDAREAVDPSVIGAQRVKGEDVYVWRVVQPVAPAVTGIIAQLLNGWSVRVAPDADLGLRIELTTYGVAEKAETFGSTYVAEVRFKLALVERGGGVLWSGEADGSAKRPGVDGRASMCNEALSVALRGALAKALSSVTIETAAPVATAPIAIEPDALLAELLRLEAGGVADEVLAGYVGQRKLSRPLTVDEILQWKNAGIPDAAIKAATRP